MVGRGIETPDDPHSHWKFVPGKVKVAYEVIRLISQGMIS